MSYGTPKASTSISESMGSSGVSSGIYGGGSSEDSSSSSSSSSSVICTEHTQVCVSYTQGPNPTHNITLTGSLNGDGFTGTSDFGGSETDVTITLEWNGTIWIVTVVLFGTIITAPLDGGYDRCDPIGLVFSDAGDPEAPVDESWIIEVLAFDACPCVTDHTTCYFRFYDGLGGYTDYTLTGSISSGFFVDGGGAPFSGITLFWSEPHSSWAIADFVAGSDLPSLRTNRCNPSGEYTYATGGGVSGEVSLTPFP